MQLGATAVRSEPAGPWVTEGPVQFPTTAVRSGRRWTDRRLGAGQGPLGQRVQSGATAVRSGQRGPRDPSSR